MSFSRIKTYQTCPRKFIKEQETEGFHNVWMEFGSKVHEGIEAMLKFQPVPVFDPEESELAKSMINQAIDWVGSKPVQTELRFALGEDLEPINWEEGGLRGVVDLLIEEEEGSEILDWKTGHVAPDKTQIMIYALAMKKMGYRITKASYFMLRFNRIVDYFVDDFVLNETEIWLREMINKINKEKKFLPTPSRECMYCSFVEDCPVSSVENVLSDEDAKKLLDDIEILKQKEKRKTEKLKEYVKRTGRNLLHKGKEYGIKYDKNGQPFYGFL